MPSEEIVTEMELERVGRITLKRVVDFDALAEGSPDAKVSIATLKEAGTYTVNIVPNGRNAKPVNRTVDNKACGLAYIQGVQDLLALKKKGPRKPKPKVDAKADAKAENGAAAPKPAKPKASKPRSAANA